MMDLGSRVPDPQFRAETPGASRVRPATRLTRRRKAAQSGEGIDQPTAKCSSSGQRTDDQQNAVIIDQGSGQMKAKAKKNTKILQEKLKKAEAQLEEKTKENENLLLASETLRDELKTVKAQLGVVTKQSRTLAEERGKAMREVEKLEKVKEELELENISISTTSFQGTCTDLNKKIKKLEKSLQTANNELVRGETTIMILEEEKEELTNQLEKIKKEKKVICPKLHKDIKDDAKTQTNPDGDTLILTEEQIKMLTEERDMAIREVSNLRMALENTPSTSCKGTVADLTYEIRKLEKKLESAKNEIISGESTILVLEGEKEELTKKLKQIKKEKKNVSSSCQKITGENGDAFEQLQKLFSEVRSLTGLSENVSSEDSALKLREAWHRHESRYQKLRDRVEGITERKRAAYANTRLLREAIEKLLDVEPGTMEITELVDKIQDIDQYYALKIDNINAKLEAKQQSSKEKLQKIRDICRATATEMDIKFKKKTKVPEFLALFSSVWNKHKGLVTSLDKKLLESNCRIEELESALDQMKEELEQTTTSKEIKTKKKRLLRTIINTMVPKQSSDEKLDKIKDQADQIRRLEAIQESKYRQDHEVLALHRESNAIRQTNDDLQKKQKELEEVILELNHRLDQEKKIVKELHETIQLLEKGDRPDPGEVLQQNIVHHVQNKQ